MAQTSCNKNASESDPACLLGFFRMKLDTIKKKKALWCVMSSSLLLLGGDRVVCHVFIIVVTGWLQGGVSCLHHCCYWVVTGWCVMFSSLLLLGGYRVVCHVFIIVVTGWPRTKLGKMSRRPFSVSCLHCCCYRVVRHVCIVIVTG